MSMKNSYLDSILEGKTSVAISGHVRPDGDCVGSTLAVYNYVRTYYPKTQVKIFLEPIPNIFKFMQYSDEIDSNYSYDGTFELFIALDCGDLGRLGKAADYFTSAVHTLCIDHHVSNQAFAEENYIFPDASATCELVFELMDRERITKEIAECLYTGIVHDTGVFQYSCTSKKTMAVAGELMEMGIDYTKIVDDTFYTKTFAQNQILGQALLNSRLYLDGACIVSTISRAEMEQYNVLPKHLDGIVNQLRVTKDVIAALFLYENEDGTWKGSLRANRTFDVAEVAQCFGGGGHVKAAGFTIEAPVDKAIERVLEEIGKRLMEHSW
jgi:phosphoesterase RecJ-like protein